MASSRGFALLFLLLACAGNAVAQATVPAVMLADVHFDPFRDPALVPALNASPIAQWPAILNRPAAPTAAAALQALQESCQTRTLDTAWPLFQRTLAAAHQAEPRPRFITLSGDLLTHQFPCRFSHTVPGAAPGDLAAFAAKTMAFVLAQTRSAFPEVPVYATLGNNDSGCADYRETPGDPFLATASAALAQAAQIPAAAVTPQGDYSVALPAPMRHARLLVVNDIFDSRLFATCDGQTTRVAEQAQLAWLQTQLEQARTRGEHVWVLAHIPPGVDVYTSFRRYIFRPAELCRAAPQPFLADEAFPDLLLRYADVIRLGLFGHTHMDEMQLLAENAAAGKVAAAIPIKIVPSVSPFIGNHAAFLVARVDPRTAVLGDWTTYVTPDPEGTPPPWVKAYDYRSTYHLPDFSAASATGLAENFAADHAGTGMDSAAFRQHFFPGDIGLYALGLAQIWPAYACTIREHSAAAVHSCICAASITPQPAPSQR